MGYIVFARKYRPQKFDEIKGQDHIVSILKSGVRNNRIPHAMLFSGPRGVGKTTTARILAKALNCEDIRDGEPCSECPTCTGIMEGRDMDVIEIDGASNRGIDEIRDLREKAKYSTVKSKYKIFIIDEIHMLTKEAFNALLKILEEPPKHVIFIFATTEPFNVIPTILSRCQRFDFRRIPVLEITGQLEYISREERIDYEIEGLKLISRLADGSMRDATSILDQLASTDKKITYDNVNMMFGRLDDEFFVGFTSTVLDKKPDKMIESLNDILQRGYDLETFVSELAFYMHKLYLIKHNIKTEEIKIMPESILNKATVQADGFSSEALKQITKELIETARELKFTSNKKMMVENELARISDLTESADIDSIIALLKHAKPAGDKKKTEKPLKNKAADKHSLDYFIDRVSEDDFFLSEALKKSTVVFAEDRYYEIKVPDTYINDVNQRRINNKIRDLGVDLELKVTYSSDVKNNKIIANPLEEDPKVIKLIEEIDGEIIQ
ncbi:MAG: DNA polymerase III subunit gamma/tau [candidate division WOR-3 bacterium]|nr:DNA polymerase III subunit gamma/tau [candidate division WOR-3 bacterium]